VIFRDELAQKVLRGEKTVTRRRMSDNPRSPWYRGGCKYRRGQVFAVQPGRAQLGIGTAVILGVGAVRLGNISEEGARFEGTTSVAAYRKIWAAINGGWDPDEIVWRLVFARRG
jgi:uncharacterized protein YqfB (UPF0267 family)